MQISGKDWQDLPKPMNLFTTRNATMVNLNTKEILRHYSANTKIVVVQRCITAEKTYYRTESAAAQNLNWAFEASAFGLPNILPNDVAPAVPNSLLNTHSKQLVSPSAANKQKSARHAVSPKAGEERRHSSLGEWKQRLKKLLSK